MKVIGLGSPCDVRVRFDACEVDVLVDILRGQRANATRDAADTYATAAREETVDDRHNRLRTVERLLVQLEEQPEENRPGAILVGETGLMRDVVREGAWEALRRLGDTQDRYEDETTAQLADALISAAETAKSWAATLTAVDGVDRGWDA